MSIKYIQGLVLAGVFGIQFLFEHVFPQRKQLNDWSNERFNITVGIRNIILTLLPAFGMAQWLHFITERKLGILNLVHAPSLVQVVAAIILLDLWMYTWHLLNHKMNFLWRFHRFITKIKK